jgi:trehalose 6-phosphate phosphatase
MVALTQGVQDIPTSSLTSAFAMRDVDVKVSGRPGAVLADPERWALFVDIDGTLLCVAATPTAVRVPAGLVQLLDALVRGLGGAAAILTGRRIADADSLFDPLKLVASGVHGTELRCERGGPIDTLAQPIPADVIQAMNKISSLASGILVEQKGSGVAVHYRNAPLARKALETELAAIVAASSYELVLREGRKVLEAVPSGYSKGTALTTLMSLPPFKGRRPVMVGDDVGDESAFLVAERLGGLGLRVAGEHYDTGMADFDGVDSVRAWLKALASRLAVQQPVQTQSSSAG